VRNFKVPYRHWLGGTEKSYENLSKDFRSLGRDTNRGPTEYEAGVTFVCLKSRVQCKL
jgi:hypothetical protein